MYDLRRQSGDDSPGVFRSGDMSRREFLRRLAIVGGGSLLGLTLACAAPLPTATRPPSPAAPAQPGETVSPNDPRIQAGPVEFPGVRGNVSGYWSQPSDSGPHPAMLIIHENRGLQPHFPDVARRFALEGYAALAIDLLSEKGGTGTFADSDAARDALREVPREHFLEDLNSGVQYMQGLPQVRPERIGAIGFCFGGGMVWLLSVKNPAIKAAAPFYGSSPPLEEVSNLRAAVLGIYAGDDDRINGGVPDLEAALKQHDKEYKFVTYPGTRHAFFNDTGGRYHAEAAGAAWTETLAWMEQRLKG